MWRVGIVVCGLAACGFNAPPGSSDLDGGTGADAADARVDGDGADARIDARVDQPPDADPSAWWNAAYRFRAPIRVMTMAAVGTEYSVRFTANTHMLVMMDKAVADGSDWRVVRHGADGWHELDRWVDDTMPHRFDGPMTETWFRLPAAVAAQGTDDQTYVYYGLDTASSVQTPLADLNRVFLFGDTFETNLDQWGRNDRGETVGIDPEHVGGTKGLKFVTTGTEAAGIHRDIALSGTVLFSHFVRQNQTAKSFGNARAFAATYAGRGNPPRWVDPTLRLPTELDSANAFQIWTTVLDNWFPNVGTNWRFSESVVDLTANTVRARVDGGAWHGPIAMPAPYNQGTPIQSIAMEGEGGQSGTFFVDNYVIRAFVDPEPTATLGAEETRP